jgi:predicted dehydrogenase
MKKNRILFVGYGSIGKQHINSLIYLQKELDFELHIDLVRSTRNKSVDEEHMNYIDNVYNIDEEVNKNYDAIFITNPTSKHYFTLKKYINNSYNFFIEKPVFDSIEYDLSFLKDLKQHKFYVACPLRHKMIIDYVQKNIDLSKVISAQAICSSYLPDWRPDIDYRNVYSSKQDMGGGVINDLIHEWDYLNTFFGVPEEILLLNGKYSELDMDVEDLAVYIIKYKDKIVELHLDYFGKYNQRKLSLFTNDSFIDLDLINNTIAFQPSNKKISFSEKKSYMKFQEIKYFLNLISGKELNNINDINFAIKTLKLSRGKII